MERTDLRIDEVEKIADTYFKEIGTERGSGYKQYQRWLYERKFHLNEAGYFISPEVENNTYQKFVGIQKKYKGSSNPWTELGPTYWKYTSSWNPGVGRITSVAVHPSDTTIIYVSSPGGGIWKSTNSGNSWKPLIDNVNSSWMTVYNLRIDPLNKNVIYAAANVVIKSSDSGTSWKATGNGPSSPKKIMVNPANSSVVFAAGSNGIWRSTNGGTSWTQVYSTTMEDIEFNPQNPNVMYASGSSSTACVIRSFNNGVSWSVIGTSAGIVATGRTLLGVSPDDPAIVYAVQASGSIFGKLYKSSDTGLTYSVIISGNSSSGTNFFGYESNGKGTTGQASYDMAICVNPLDVDEIHIAGIICWKSTDGGSNFTAETEWKYPTFIGYNHADVHVLEWVNHTIYSGSDGGVFKSFNNGDTWINLSVGLGIKQFYKIACAKTDANVITGGAQDNGSSFRQTSGNWVDWLGADGMDNVISPTNPAIAIGTSQNGSIYKTTNSGASKTDLSKPNTGNWVTPLVMHPTSHDTVYGGWTGIYKSINGGINWFNISAGVITGKLTAIAVAPSNVKYIYGSIGSTLYRTSNGGSSWTSINAPSSITSIFVSQTNPEKIWITCSSSSARVFVSTNMGTSFTDLSSGLPSLAARSIVVEDNALEGIYVGMNVGVYYRDNKNSSWILHGEGLPLVAINEVEIQESSGKLRVATYGRGVWESDLQNITPCQIPVTLKNNDIRITSANVNWSAIPGAKSYTVENKETSSTDWVGTTTTGDTTISFTGLTPGTKYDWHVSTNCEIRKTAFIQDSFKTEISCAIPTEINTIEITHKSALINWNAVPGALSYQVEYKEVSSAIWASSKITTDTFQNLIGLKSTTKYNWRVKTNCRLDSSNYSMLAFTTEVNGILDNMAIKNTKLRVYPIPASQVLNYEFEIKKDMKDIKSIITNIEGKELFKTTFDHKCGMVSKQIEVKEFSEGLYFLTIENEQGKMVQKFLISK